MGHGAGLGPEQAPISILGAGRQYSKAETIGVLAPFALGCGLGVGGVRSARWAFAVVS